MQVFRRVQDNVLSESYGVGDVMALRFAALQCISDTVLLSLLVMNVRRHLINIV